MDEGNVIYLTPGEIDRLSDDEEVMLITNTKLVDNSTLIIRRCKCKECMEVD